MGGATALALRMAAHSAKRLSKRRADAVPKLDAKQQNYKSKGRGEEQGSITLLI